MTTLARRLRWLVPVCAVMVLALSAPTPAAAETHCFSDYYSCNGRAARIDDFWGRFAAGLDCEVDLLVCLNTAIMK